MIEKGVIFCKCYPKNKSKIFLKIFTIQFGFVKMGVTFTLRFKQTQKQLKLSIMKKQKTPPTEFTFYKGNRVDQEFVLSLQELREKYLAYLNTKDPDWILYYHHQTVNSFVTSIDGLNSTPAQPMHLLQDILVDVRHSLPCYKS